jgi:V-type H+-transporting ATPase subunit a
MYSGSPYVFGVDPVKKKHKLLQIGLKFFLFRLFNKVWQLAVNKITYTNTLKMKFSIIMGVMQMIFGLIIAFHNHMLVCVYFFSTKASALNNLDNTK